MRITSRSPSAVLLIVFGFAFAISNLVWLPAFQWTINSSLPAAPSSTDASSMSVLAICFFASMSLGNPTHSPPDTWVGPRHEGASDKHRSPTWSIR